MRLRIELIIPFVIFLFSSCEEGVKQIKTEIVQEQPAATLPPKIKHNSLNPLFVGDTMLSGYSNQIQEYLNAYQNDSCGIIQYNDSALIKEFEGLNDLGDLNGDKTIDKVFVLPPLNYCENGQSYYFSDPELPRLLTDSYCCHPKSIFNVGDIDEDGVSEIGQYYSSCASRYKSLYVYSLKANQWKEVGSCTFDLGYSSADKGYKSCVKKTGKGKFQMFEFTDLPQDTTKVGKKYWLSFEF